MSDKRYIPRMRSLYASEIQEKLMKDLNISNVMLVPQIDKIVLNMGLGNAKLNKNTLKQAEEEMALISGQKAVITYAKKAISNFKIREGDPVGVKVTLRADNMYDFLDRFISVASPRIRDFRGISSNGFDGRGNYNFGIDEQIIFPEIDYDKVNEIRGLNCTIVTSTDSDDQAYALVKAFGFPIKDRKSKNKNIEQEGWYNMAKKSMIVKNIRRREIVERYREKRLELKKLLKNPSVSEEEKQIARVKLEKMPRDSNPIRIRNRCVVTGRPRSYYRKFGLSRITFREMALKGEIPGITKASW